MSEEFNEEVEETTGEVAEEVEEAATEETEAEETETEDTEEETEKPKKGELPKGVQKRIDKITRQRYEAERQVEELRRQLEAKTADKPISTEKPKLEDFDYDDIKYVDALTDWKVQQAIAAREQQAKEQQKHVQQEQVYQDFENRRIQTLTKGVTAHEDFEDVVIDNPEVVITPQMAEVITVSDIGHEIAYYLGKNPGESARIAGLTPLNQAREIGKLEDRLASQSKKKVSSAPKPAKTVGAKGASPNQLDPSKNLKAWIQARNEGKI